MNLANKLTLFRVILIPFFVLFLLGDFGLGKAGALLAFVIFIVASLTDMLDGKVARKYNLITNFGKFMDPLADKLLVGAALVCFVKLSLAPAWLVIVILSREFVISGVRLIAAEQQIVIAASWWGKWKTAVQLVAIDVLLFHCGGDLTVGGVAELYVLGEVLMYASLVLTIVSLIEYLRANAKLFVGQM